MTLHLLQRERQAGRQLAAALEAAMLRVEMCQQCRNLTEHTICGICRDVRRDAGSLCIVESPADILAIEQAGGFNGRYFVLNGHLSPLDGIGPEQLGLDLLLERVEALELKEIIIATNPTVEGEATSHYLAQMLAGKVEQISRIAHGVPLGGEIEYTDGGTLAHALQGRRSLG